MGKLTLLLTASDLISRVAIASSLPQFADFSVAETFNGRPAKVQLNDIDTLKLFLPRWYNCLSTDRWDRRNTHTGAWAW
jgi:hypothetical protein